MKTESSNRCDRHSTETLLTGAVFIDILHQKKHYDFLALFEATLGKKGLTHFAFEASFEVHSLKMSWALTYKAYEWC